MKIREKIFFVKKIKNPNALDTYLSRKEKKRKKVHFSKLPPVSQKTRFPIHPVIYFKTHLEFLSNFRSRRF